MKLKLFRKNIFVLTLVVLGLQACSTRLPPAGVAAYNSCQYENAIDIFFKTNKKDKDLLLYDLAILSSAVHGGNKEEAKKSGARAQDQMWGYEGKGRGAVSLLSSEAIRVYKGEPFEKSMASMYLGIMYFNDGDYENAKAAFTKAMLAIETKNEDSKADFAAPLLLLAKTYLKFNDEDNAKIILGRLEKITANKSITIDRLRKIKTIFFVELGRGPEKIRTGPGDSLIAWNRQYYPERYAELEINEKPVDVGLSIRDDLTYQASSSDRGGKTAIQGTKGTLRELSTITAVVAANEAANRKNKTAGLVALGAGLFALADQSQADIRQWELLPDQLNLVLSEAQLLTGRYQFGAKFFGANQNHLSTLDQVWYDDRNLDVEKIYIVRANNCSGFK